MTPSLPVARDLFEDDVACLNCGYNLRGLSRGGDCPECGMAARVSLRHDRLADADPVYLGHLKRGSLLLLIGVVLAFPLVYPGLVVATIGMWMMTAGEPGRAEPARDRAIRSAGRMGVSLGLMGLVVLTLVTALALGRGRATLAGEFEYLDIGFIAFNAVYFLGLLAFVEHLSFLGQRLPDEGLVRACRRCRLTWIAGVAGFAVIGLGTNVVEVWRGVLPHVQVWGPLVAASGLAVVLVVLWVATLRLSVGVFRRFRSLV